VSGASCKLLPLNFHEDFLEKDRMGFYLGAAHVVLKIDGPHGNQAEITLLLYRLCTDIFSVLIFLAFH